MRGILVFTDDIFLNMSYNPGKLTLMVDNDNKCII